MTEPKHRLYDDLNDMQQNGNLVGTDYNGMEVAVPVYIYPPKNRDYNIKWGIFWQSDAEGTGMSMLEMAANKALNLTDMRVRDYVMCKCGIGNFVHLSQTEAAEYLGIPQPHVSTSIKKLITMGIILEGPRAGKFRSYQVNPSLMYAGSIKKGVTERSEAIKEAKTKAKAKILEFTTGKELKGN